MTIFILTKVIGFNLGRFMNQFWDIAVIKIWCGDQLTEEISSRMNRPRPGWLKFWNDRSRWLIWEAAKTMFKKRIMVK